jgi:hypothetical protein
MEIKMVDNFPDLNSRKFEQWLIVKDNCEIVGINGKCGFCPIAQYANEIYPITNDWWMFGSEMFWRRNIQGKDYKLPEWAEHFIALIDLIGQGREIKKEEAIDTLKKALER